MRIVCNEKRRFYYSNSRRSNKRNTELMGTTSHVKEGIHNKTKDCMMRLLTAASDGNAIYLITPFSSTILYNFNSPGFRSYKFPRVSVTYVVFSSSTCNRTKRSSFVFVDSAWISFVYLDSSVHQLQLFQVIASRTVDHSCISASSFGFINSVLERLPYHNLSLLLIYCGITKIR